MFRGLNRINPENQKFIHYKYELNTGFVNGEIVLIQGSLRTGTVSKIFEDKSGDIWIANRGLAKFNREKKIFIIYNDKIGNIYSMYEDKSGIIWIGTDGGLYKFNRNKNTFFCYKNDPNNPLSISSNRIGAICEHKSGVLWIGTSHGLDKFDQKREQFIHYKHDPEDYTSLSDDHIISLYKDKDKNLWIGTFNGGLNKLIYNEDAENSLPFIKYLNNHKNPGSISNNKIFSIYEDKSGIMWVGTYGGLNKFDRENNSFKHFRVKDGLISDIIFGVLEDDYGNIWLGTSKGISKFDPETNKFRNYNQKDGLLNSTFTQWGFLKIKSGEFLFGGNDGLDIFNPNKLKDNPHIPPIVITDFKLLHKSVPIGFDKSANRTILEKSITYTKEIELNYEDNVITFEFAALDFRCPEKNQYAYKMEGFDKDWIYTDASRRYATYTNLDPGEYTFRVKGSNNDGIWNEEGTSLKIKILPDLRSRFFADISHEFRTPLTLILGPLKQIIEETKESKTLEEAEMAEKSAERLNVLVNQLLDLSRVVTGNMKLQASAENIIPFLKGLTLSFASLAERRKITLRFTCRRKILKVFFDKDKLEKIVTNILSNAFKFTEPEGIIEVNVQCSDGKTEIKISDTGIGIPKEKLNKIFDRFYQIEDKHKRRGEGAGIGLALTRELVELHKGEIKAESELGKGTTITVSLPLGKHHLLPEEIFRDNYKEAEENVSSIREAEEEADEEETDLNLITETKKPLLMIIDDNSDVRAYIRGYLGKQYRILEAVDGKDGIDKALDYIPDLIVSDVMMPVINGFELCKTLKSDERTSHIPIILLTAKAAGEDKVEGLETGADDYIMKPFDAKELQVRTSNLILQRSKLRERFRREAALPIKKGKYSQIDEEFLKKAIDDIEKHISEQEFTLDAFGHDIGMSRSQLHRKLSALTGHSPHNFIRFIRLKQASELLCKGAGNITEIALEVGFNNLSHFAKAFKEQFGKTPSEYIKVEN